MKRVRCAIYTRKSSEEGLEQDFNSLHAQREACAAYVLSQASEGWSLIKGEYDDGGVSGGTLERPGLQRLLADIAAGKIDIVVVYKVDRLTRSLLDFAKLVEAFDEHGTSFVSVTQSFNTTTSMGRLTLNMLLSFAQFEREVTAERIRDKIAASKAKGMWMGGTPPLGYAPDGRSLKIIEGEASLVRDIFARYLKAGTVRALADQLRAEGIDGLVRTLGMGRKVGGKPMSRGQLYYLLNNPIYTGRIRHCDKIYAGQHPAIIDTATWEAVQALLAENTQGTVRRRTARPSLLAGLVHDDEGEPLIASHASKAANSGGEGGTVRYRYYVSRSVQNGDSSNKPGLRIPARELEDAVVACLTQALTDPLELASRLGALDMARLAGLAPAAASLAGRLRQRDPEAVRSLVAGIEVRSGEIRIDLAAPALARALQLDPPDTKIITLTAPVRLTRTGHALRLVTSDGRRAGSAQPKDKLIALILKGRGWWAQLASGETDVASIARAENLTPSYVTRVTRLAFLSPRVLGAIVAGEQPVSLDAGQLLAPGFPACWQAQERMFLGA